MESTWSLFSNTSNQKTYSASWNEAKAKNLTNSKPDDYLSPIQPETRNFRCDTASLTENILIIC